MNVSESKELANGFVWVFMSEYADEGARSAPSAIFSSYSCARQWIKKIGLRGNLYKFPIDVPLAEYAEPIFGSNSFQTKQKEERPDEYNSGKSFLGYIDHEHFFD